MRVLSVVLCGLAACGKTATDAAADAGAAGAHTSAGGAGGSAASSASGASGASSSAGAANSPGQAGASAGGHTGGSLGEGGSAEASAGQAGMSSTTQRPFCGGTVTPANSSWCSGLDKAVLSDPKLLDLEGGTLAAGEDGKVQVTLTNPGSQSYTYPCVGFAVDSDAVALGPGNPTFFLFSLGKGSASFSLPVHVNAAAQPGTVVHFTAWVDALHAGCTNGAELHWAETIH